MIYLGLNEHFLSTILGLFVVPEDNVGVAHLTTFSSGKMNLTSILNGPDHDLIRE